MQILETEHPQHAGIDDGLGALLCHGRILHQVLTPANAVSIRETIGPSSTPATSPVFTMRQSKYTRIGRPRIGATPGGL